MTNSSDLDHFCERLAEVGLSQVDNAVALLWFADHFSPGVEKTVHELARQMEAATLTGKVNISRLKASLARSKHTVRGHGRDTFRIRLTRKPALGDDYIPLLKRRPVAVSDAVLPDGIVTGTRPYLEDLGCQINGCYDYRFYDGCAVMCRRMVESLLISAFEKAGYRAAIEDSSGNLVGLDEIIGRAKSGQFIKLGRGTAKVLEKVKEIGDTAAHDRYYITREQDIEEFRSGFRRAASELLALAGIKPKV